MIGSIELGFSIIGKIDANHRVDCVISDHNSVSGEICNMKSIIGSACVPIRMLNIGVADYEGDYEVVPKVVSQVLNTENKRMNEDVTVKSVPYYEVSNVEGGTTVYIASEVD